MPRKTMTSHSGKRQWVGTKKESREQSRHSGTVLKDKRSKMWLKFLKTKQNKLCSTVICFCPVNHVVEIQPKRTLENVPPLSISLLMLLTQYQTTAPGGIKRYYSNQNWGHIFQTEAFKVQITAMFWTVLSVHIRSWPAGRCSECQSLLKETEKWRAGLPVSVGCDLGGVVFEALAVLLYSLLVLAFLHQRVAFFLQGLASLDVFVIGR